MAYSHEKNPIFFETKIENITRSIETIAESLNKSIVEFNCKVYDEDRKICELNQKGVEECSKLGILGSGEKRLYEFQKAYNIVLNG